MEDMYEEGREDKTEDLDLRQALLKLKEEERRIVILRYFEEEKLETIAEVLDLKVGTVKSRLYRAVEKLKKYMELEENKKAGAEL